MTNNDLYITNNNDNNHLVKDDNNVQYLAKDDGNIQRLAKEERETILRYNEADGYWEVYTAVQAHIRKCDSLGYELTDVDYYEDGTVAGKFYKVPKNAIGFKAPNRKRNLTDEQRTAMAERLKAAREKKNKR
jgi:hypothetical protein